jgi:pilus assembly protein Flp/PilA
MTALSMRIAQAAIELTRRGRRQDGQGMVEYGLIIVLVAIAVIVTLTALGGQLNTVFTSIKNSLSTT